MRRYFRVTCKHGHFGNGRYQPISFSILAKDAVTAMNIAKAMPGVKHTAMVLTCQEISCAEFLNNRKVSAYRRMEGLL